MRSSLRWLIAMAGATLAFALLPAVAPADGPKPTIESESASHVTATDATLEAQINPGSGEDGFSLATTYEFFLESPWCGSFRLFGGCEASGGTLVYKGTIPAGATAPQLESVDLASVGHTLSPGTAYGYRVVADNEVGEAFGGEKTFTTPAEGKAPVIESVSISNLTPTDATLEATIDTEGATTFYEFLMWSSPCSKHGSGCELLARVPLPFGVLTGSFVPDHVSLDLNSGAHVTLGPGEYGFSVKAINGAGETEAAWQSFEAPEEGAKPLGPTISPGPVGNEPTVPLGGHSAGSGTPGPTVANGIAPAPSKGGGDAKYGYGTKGKSPKGKHKKHKKHKQHKPHEAKTGKRR
jgi:hypothetical protein